MKKSWERVTEALRKGEAWRYYPSAYVQFEGQMLDAEAWRIRNDS